MIDIPKDVTSNKTEYVPEKITTGTAVQRDICREDLDHALDMIRKGKKPYIFVGGGAVLIRSQQRDSYEFVKKVDAPVTDSLMGKGAFSGNG